jgi:hypothetical protein
VPNPEQGPIDIGIAGEWQQVGLVVPDFLEPIRDTIDSVFTTIIRILDILVRVLDLLKIFASGLLDPLVFLVQQVRNLVEGLLNDFRQLGIYIHGDFYIAEPSLEKLRGGYPAFEGRMVARFQDQSDPERPNFSSNSTGIACFLLVQADIRGVSRIIQLLEGIDRLFNRDYPIRSMLNSVSNVQATYGYDGATVASFNKDFFKGFLPRQRRGQNPRAPYNAVNLTWQMAPIPGASFPSNPIVPPKGFLIEISVTEQPIKVVCERFIKNANATGNQKNLNQPARTEVIDCVDDRGNPIELYGGAEQLDISSSLSWNNTVDGLNGGMKPDSIRVYGLRNRNDRAPIDLTQLEDNGRHYLQRTFFVKSNIFFPGKGFGATLLYSDMPYNADFELDGQGKLRRINDSDQPEQFFVRVRAVNPTDGIVPGPITFQYTADAVNLQSPSDAILTLKPQGNRTLFTSQLGPPSDRRRILFPDTSTQDYLEAVSQALTIVALCRPDLPVLSGTTGPFNAQFPQVVPDTSNNSEANVFLSGRAPNSWQDFTNFARLETKLETIAQFVLPQVVGRRQIKKYFEETNADLAKFRKKTYSSVRSLTNRYLDQNLPPLAARQLAVDRAQDLLNFKVGFNDDGEIFTTVDPDDEGRSLLSWLQDTGRNFGISPNPSSMGVAGNRNIGRAKLNALNKIERAPHFFFYEGRFQSGQTTKGSQDRVPVFYSISGVRINDIAFIRNLIPDSVYEGAAFVLQLAAGQALRPQEGGWIAYRAFPMGLPDVDDFFDRILAFLEAIQASLDSIAQTIVNYIEFLQARVRELQALLNQINNMIQRLLRFFISIPSGAGLIVVGSGTAGLVSGLVASTNKPTLPPPIPALDTYTGGIVLVAGGIPTIALDLFAGLFQGKGNEFFGEISQNTKSIAEAAQAVGRAPSKFTKSIANQAQQLEPTLEESVTALTPPSPEDQSPPETEE